VERATIRKRVLEKPKIEAKFRNFTALNVIDTLLMTKAFTE